MKISQYPVDGSPQTTDTLLGDQASGPSTVRFLISNLISTFFQNVVGSDMAKALATQPNVNQCLINGGFRIWQRGTTFTTPNSGTYLADRWYQQQVANGAWTFSRDTTVPTSSQYALKGVNVTANDQCILLQFLEAADAIPLRGQTVSLSFWAQTQSAQISNLRATVLQWGGTADSPTKAVVNTWHGNGTDPAWATNWSAAQAGTNAALTNSWQQFKIEGIPLNTNLNNLAVAIWVDDSTITAGDTFWVTGVQLNLGSKAMGFEPMTYVEELQKCQRYYLVVRDTNQDYCAFATGFVTGVQFQVATPVSMRASPTITGLNLGHRFGGADYTLSSPAVLNFTAAGIAITATSSGSPGNGNVSAIWTNAGGKLYFDAEL